MWDEEKQAERARERAAARLGWLSVPPAARLRVASPAGVGEVEWIAQADAVGGGTCNLNVHRAIRTEASQQGPTSWPGASRASAEPPIFPPVRGHRFCVLSTVWASSIIVAVAISSNGRSRRSQDECEPLERIEKRVLIEPADCGAIACSESIGWLVASASAAWPSKAFSLRRTLK